MASLPIDATAFVAVILIAFRASVCLVPGSSGRATCCARAIVPSNDRIRSTVLLQRGEDVMVRRESISTLGILEGATWTIRTSVAMNHTVTARATRWNMREAHDAALDGAPRSKRRRGDDDPSAPEVPDFTHVLVRAGESLGQITTVPFCSLALGSTLTETLYPHPSRCTTVA